MRARRNNLGQRLRLLLPWSFCCLSSVHVPLQIGGQCRRMHRVFRHTVEELPYPGMLVCAYLFFCSNGEQFSVEQHGEAVGDAEGTGQLMGDHKRRNLKSFLEK